ncbi:dihydroneopterin aldolase [Pedobacter immunditicola]|uniref:dihydroneopterin aldolase n=1 Tax=Pedobacter immunditicola TaxID=3133440 RepID=UPI0030A4D6ED
MFIQTVALKDVKFFSFHGYYPEEQLIGSHFMVSATVTFLPSEDSEALHHTVNYEVLNAIMGEEMVKTQQLLETVVKNILYRILGAFPFLLTIEVGIKKLNPCMPGAVHHSFVQLHYTASEQSDTYYKSF